MPRYKLSPWAKFRALSACEAGAPPLAMLPLARVVEPWSSHQAMPLPPPVSASASSRKTSKLPA
jgi:hypothetical protein